MALPGNWVTVLTVSPTLSGFLADDGITDNACQGFVSGELLPTDIACTCTYHDSAGGLTCGLQGLSHASGGALRMKKGVADYSAY